MKELFFVQSPTSKSPLYFDSSILPSAVVAAPVVAAASATLLTMAATLSGVVAAATAGTVGTVGTVGTAGTVGTSGTAGMPPGSCLLLRPNPGSAGTGGGAGTAGGARPSPSVVAAAIKIKFGSSFALDGQYNLLHV
jgi:hypothetical protein